MKHGVLYLSIPPFIHGVRSLAQRAFVAASTCTFFDLQMTRTSGVWTCRWHYWYVTCFFREAGAVDVTIGPHSLVSATPVVLGSLSPPSSESLKVNFCTDSGEPSAEKGAIGLT